MEPAEVVSAPVKPARRMAKPLSERSPITAGLLALICILGAVFTFASFNGKAANEGHIFGAVYLLFAAIEIFVAVRIYRARGGSWR